MARTGLELIFAGTSFCGKGAALLSGFVNSPKWGYPKTIAHLSTSTGETLRVLRPELPLGIVTPDGRFLSVRGLCPDFWVSILRHILHVYLKFVDGSSAVSIFFLVTTPVSNLLLTTIFAGLC